MAILTVKLNKVTNLKDGDTIGKTDPYIKFELEQDVSTHNRRPWRLPYWDSQLSTVLEYDFRQELRWQKILQETGRC